MSKNDSFLKFLDERVKIKNQQITEDNFRKVESWNNEIQEDLKKISNILKNTRLETFDSEKYYQKMMIPLKINKYVPLPKPNEKSLRKQAGCIKENKLLEHFIKDRTEKRIKNAEKFEKLWKQENDKYQKEEQKHFDEYTKYKNEEIKKNNELNKDTIKKQKKYNSNDSEEIKEILGKFINSYQNIGYGKQVFISYDKGNAEINFELLNPNSDLNKVKYYRYLKTKFEAKEVLYSKSELETIYENIVFNVMLACASKLQYYLDSKINNLIINGYIKAINSANGNMEDFNIFSCKLVRGDIPFNSLNLIDSKAFFDSHGARYSLPLISIKKIKPYEFDSNDLIDTINSNNITGFDFEKLSKTLLEKNGFDNVEVTKASGDYGADVIAFKDGVKYAIQCKKFSAPVGVKAVQEVLASKSMYHCHVGVVLTNNYFTPSAIKLAETNGILLWNKVKLDEMIEKSGLDSNKTLRKVSFSNDSINTNSMDYSEELENDENSDNNRNINQELEDRMNNLDLEDGKRI